MDSELREFTREALREGRSREEIARVLSEAGWPRDEMEAALDLFAEVDFSIPVPKPKPYLSAREVFNYLVLFAAFYVSAFNVGDLFFEFINRAFPDPLAETIYSPESNSGIRWNIATLIISFPLFLFMFRNISRAIAEDPTKRSSRARKWLTYMTLFIAAFALAGDAITLVYNALGGELTIRFVLKVFVVAALAGGTFTYFLLDMRKEET